MKILDIPPELLLSILDLLSLRDLVSFRSTCCQLRNFLNQRFQKIYLEDVKQLTAIQWAAVHGYAELIELAIANGAKIDNPLREDLRWMKVSEAVSVYGNKVYEILDWANRGAESYAKNSIIRTPLFLAACFGQVKAIEVLLKQGASMQCFGEMMTPAHISAGRGDVDCLRAFIQARFNINTRGTNDQTILHVATFSGIKMIKYIVQLKGGANLVNARDNKGFTPLSYLATIASYDRPQRRTRKMVEVLLQHGADIHAADNSGYMAAHYFATRGWIGCLRALINGGFDLYSRGAHGETILHCAVAGGKVITEYLLGLDEGKVIIDIENDQGKTPLQFASELSNKGPVLELLMHYSTTCSSH